METANQYTHLADWRARHVPEMLGSHPSLWKILHVLERVAETDCSVLISGESGTGKELVAKALHQGCSRRNKAFVPVNCAAIPENLLESELFGHARGAFSGAMCARVGRFVAADGGTLFLDEVGELPMSLQAKILRVLQDKVVTPVGENRGQRVDVRIVAATNRDLEKEVAEGRFREDLLYRLNIIPVELPALRERSSDIPTLIEAFIAEANKRWDRSIEGVSPEALKVLCEYDWPGNIRQLLNTIERMVVLKSTGVLGWEDCPPKVCGGSSLGRGSSHAFHLPDGGIDLRDAVEQFENALILQALERTGGNKNRAAAILRMNRTTLVEKVKKKSICDTGTASALAC